MASARTANSGAVKSANEHVANLMEFISYYNKYYLSNVEMTDGMLNCECANIVTLMSRCEFCNLK